MKRVAYLFITLVFLVTSSSIFVTTATKATEKKSSPVSPYHDITSGVFPDGSLPMEEATYGRHATNNALQSIGAQPKQNSYVAPASLPSSVDLSTSNAFPPIKDQGDLNSCASFAIVYYQFTYEVNRMLGSSASSTANQFSPMWPYIACTYTGLSISVGASPDDIYDFIARSGALRWSEDPYNGSTYTTYWPTNKTAMRNALKIRTTAIPGTGANWGVVTVTCPSNTISSPTSSLLSEVKSLLNSGKVLAVTTYSSFEAKRTSTNEWAIVRSNRVAGGHEMVIVGYNDNIWVDLNGNGLVDTGEKGAFKVANSGGTGWGNNGYAWVLYDALNKTSCVSGWESGYSYQRAPVFSYSVSNGIGGTSNNNHFKYILVEQKDVMLVADLELKNIVFDYDEAWEVEDTFSLTLARTNSSGLNRVTGNTYYYTGIGNTLGTRYLLADYADLAKPISSYLYNYRWEMNIDYRYILFSKNPSVKYCITDDAGNQIKPYSSFTLSGATSRTSSTLLKLSLGDVDYSESLTSADAQLVLKYAVGSLTPSTLQAYLADYDGNGVIDTTDARLILQNI